LARVLRLKALAQSRGTPLNRLFDEIATQMLIEFDAEARFRIRTAKGNGRVTHGLALLQKAIGQSFPSRAIPTHTYLSIENAPMAAFSEKSSGTQFRDKL
jgi:hypothetical protein